jgi:hypothetical protein
MADIYRILVPKGTTVTAKKDKDSWPVTVVANCFIDEAELTKDYFFMYNFHSKITYYCPAHLAITLKSI